MNTSIPRTSAPMSERTVSEYTAEVKSGQRFEFGKNWRKFLGVLTEARIATAAESLQAYLGVSTLAGKRFLDIGCGSGLFSLAARHLGAEVTSFDYDPQAVGCAQELRRRYFPQDAQGEDSGWRVAVGSALDADYVRGLGTFDVVYSWGVLHHTGAMWQALANAALPVAPGGQLFISIYNDQGKRSRQWRQVKRAYNRLPPSLRFVILWPAVFCFLVFKDLLKGRPFHKIRTYSSNRGMSAYRDLVDWVGGYPFEVATPDQIFDFYRERGFTLQRLHTCGGGLGCNEFVFRRGEE